MQIESCFLPLQAELDTRIIRKGHSELIDVSKRLIEPAEAIEKLNLSPSILPSVVIGGSALLLTLVAEYLGIKTGPASNLALVTVAGTNYMAADFMAASTNHINQFNYHDCGTNTTAAQVTDVGLISPAGTARVQGTQSSPATDKYRTVALITFSSPIVIAEWGLFSASTGPTLWDRRTHSPLSVAEGDAIQYTYTLQIPSGGS
jgi:hypothetical protein